MARICVVACVKTKHKGPARAKDLYSSALFRKCREFAERYSDRWYVLSAKHHLLNPETVIDHYESTLYDMPSGEREEWARRVYDLLPGRIRPDDEIVLLAGQRYREKLEPLLRQGGYRVEVPMRRMPIGRQLKWLNRQLAERDNPPELESFYSTLRELEAGLGGGRVLQQCTGRQAWPERGVYFFFEPGEFRFRDRSERRVVRVGTHMVSRGSKATLWSRLRTHRGTKKGTGNHRASIFRRHVGEAIMAKEGGRVRVVSWGRGKSAARDTVEAEKHLERLVSGHIGKMSVLWLDVPDRAAPESDRAFLERNAIALLSGAGREADPPGETWLGRYSPTGEISTTGLWNVDWIGHPFDERFLEVFAVYVEITLGRRSRPEESLSGGWYLTRT